MGVIFLKKNGEFHFRLSEQEIQKFDKKAQQYGLTKSKLLRKFINDETLVTVSYEQTIKELIGAVNKIGVNINQIAKKANESGASSNDLLSLKVYQRELIRVCEEVIENCHNKNTEHERK